MQNVTAGTFREIGPCLLSRYALRQRVKRKRRDLPAEPEYLNNLFVPPKFTTTINRDEDVRMGEERILIFVTDANIVNLRNASVWIMDETL